MEDTLKDTKKLYRRYRNRSRNKYAVVLDRILLCIIMFVAFTLAFFGKGFCELTSVILSLCSVTVISVVFVIAEDITLNRYISKQRQEIKLEQCRRKLLVMEKSEYEKYAESAAKQITDSNYYLCATQSVSELTEDFAAQAMRIAVNQNKDTVVIAALCKDEKNFSELEEIFDVKLIVLNYKQLCEHYLYQNPIDDDCADDSFKQKYETIKKKRFSILKNINLSGRQTKFFGCALMLFVFSFLVNYPLYYRILAILCFWLGIGITVFSRIKKETVNKKDV